jgi:cytochrome c oxidase subunit 2
LLFSVILLVLTLLASLLFAFHPVWFPIPVTADAVAFDRQFTWTLWITGAIFVLAQLFLALTVGRRRASAPSAPGHIGKRRERTWVETAWALGSAILFLMLSILGSRGWAKVSTGTAGKEIIEVNAYQFAWSFRYPGHDGRFGRVSREFISDSGGNSAGIDPKDPAGKDDISAATLRIPAQRDVLLLLHSRDVIHDFFVRELRTKQDIVPGMEIPLELHVDVPGTYEIACAELCGLGHSQMRSAMIVMPPDDYDRWKRDR